MGKNWGRERFSLSSNYSCTASFLLYILLAKLKNLYIYHARILILKRQNSTQKMKIEKTMVFVKTFDHYHHSFNFGHFFSCPLKLQKDLK